MKFKTNYIYTDRRTKARYVYQKYRSILVGNILDVGADQCYLKDYLGDNANYVGAGLCSNNLDLEIDLERQSLPYDDNLFDVVLCLDVLEHLDNLHEVYDELCRVSNKYVIISLPNCHRSFFSYLKTANYKRDSHRHMKFYGLPFEKPGDRHKWFFSTDEAEAFIQYRSKKNHMEIVQIDVEIFRKPLLSIFEILFFKMFFRKYSNFTLKNRNLYTGRLWAVLKKKMSDKK